MGYLSYTDCMEFDLYKVQTICIRDVQDCHSDAKTWIGGRGGGLPCGYLEDLQF